MHVEQARISVQSVRSEDQLDYINKTMWLSEFEILHIIILEHALTLGATGLQRYVKKVIARTTGNARNTVLGAPSIIKNIHSAINNM